MGSAEQILVRLRERPPTLHSTAGPGRVVCLEGRSGSGKSTLAAELATLTPCTLLHMDDLYDGWTGLLTVRDQLGSLLGPLSTGEPGQYRRYDWETGAYQETVWVPPSPLLVLEGAGSYTTAYDSCYTLVVWLEGATEQRRRRALDRDGEMFRPYWADWAEAEDALYAREGTRQRADLLLHTDDGG